MIGQYTQMLLKTKPSELFPGQSTSQQNVVNVWSASDEAQLIALANDKHTTPDDYVKHFPSRSVRAVQTRLSLLRKRGLAVRSQHPCETWTHEEINTLIKMHAEKQTCKKIGKALSRSVSSVGSKLANLRAGNQL